MNSDVRRQARAYLQAGWVPIPVLRGRKAPQLKNWPSLRLSEAEIDQHFNANDNVGILLGEPSGGLVDVDLDDQLAATLARRLLPATDRKHGRRSKPQVGSGTPTVSKPKHTNESAQCRPLITRSVGKRPKAWI
jgi:hypothetical protein